MPYKKLKTWPHRLARPRTSGSHPENWGSNPHEVTKPRNNPGLFIIFLLLNFYILYGDFAFCNKKQLFDGQHLFLSSCKNIVFFFSLFLFCFYSTFCFCRNFLPIFRPFKTSFRFIKIIYLQL